MSSPDYISHPDISVIRDQLKTPQAEMARFSIRKISESISDSLDSDIGQSFPAKEPRLSLRTVILDEKF